MGAIGKSNLFPGRLLNATILSRVAALCCSCSLSVRHLQLEKQSPLSSVEGLAGLCSSFAQRLCKKARGDKALSSCPLKA